MNLSKALPGGAFSAFLFVNKFLLAVCIAVTGIGITGVTFTPTEGATKLPS